MTTNSEMVLNFLKKNYGKEFTKAEIAEALGISIPAVTGSLNGLIKNKYAVTTHTDDVVLAEATETRKAQIKKVQFHTLTEAGLAYDPVAAAEERAAAKEAEKAKAAAKA